METGHSHSHSHAHSHSDGAGDERGLKIALGLTATILLAEVVGAIVTNSLALLSDAAHMLTDVTSLVIALIAIRLARRPADHRRTFGYYRFEILAAVLNAVLLFLAAAYIVFEAVQRFYQPKEIASTGMLIVATIGLVANGISMWVLQSRSHESLNMRGAYLEVMSDALGSVGVILAAILIHFTKWWPIDPIVAIAIGLWVLPRTWKLLQESVNILLNGVPDGLALDAIHTGLLEIPGVRDVHDLHVWSITAGKNTLTAHLVLDGSEPDCEVILQSARSVIQKFGISQSTVQIETSRYDH